MGGMKSTSDTIPDARIVWSDLLYFAGFYTLLIVAGLAWFHGHETQALFILWAHSCHVLSRMVRENKLPGFRFIDHGGKQ